MVVDVGLPCTGRVRGPTRRHNKGLTPRLQNKWVDYHFLSIQDPKHTHSPIAPGVFLHQERHIVTADFT